MSERKVKRRRLKKYSVGDLRDRIRLERRDITAPEFGTTAFTETYTLIAEVWAGVETSSFAAAGERIFAEVDDPQARPSHMFIIRYRSGVTSETRIRWRDKLYEIMEVSDPEERRQYLELRAKLAGDEAKEANQ